LMKKKINTQLVLRAIKDFGKVLILMVDEAVIIALIVLILHFVGIQITVPIIIGAATIFVILVFVRHIMVIPTFHKKQVTGREGMIGEQGRVVEPLTPFGTVIVRGEYWKAESLDEHLGFNEDVEIVGFEGLTLKVVRKGLSQQ
jgi:membrane-bound ClpP family serine protease